MRLARIGCLVWMCLGLLAAEPSCAQHDAPPTSGVYINGPAGKLLLLPDSALAPMRVVGQHTRLLRRLDSLYAALTDTSFTGQPIAVQFRGRAYPGRNGAVGDFHLTEIVAAQRLTAWNGEGFYTYWALGTEPFWDLMLSHRLGVAALFDPNAAQFFVFPLSAPQHPEDGVADYTVTHKGHTLRVRIQGGECSDGMSDRLYPFRAEVFLDGRALNGCALSPGNLGALREE